MKTNAEQGKFRLAASANPTASHNPETWTKIQKHFDRVGSITSYDALVAVARGHLHRGEDSSNPHQFIDYCIKQGWLKRVDCTG
jgi:hypothetical protein